MSNDIVTKGAKILSETGKEVPKKLFGTPELHKIIVRMSKAVRKTDHGVAIAANQIGLPYRIFVVRGFVLAGKERSDEDPDAAFINPKIVRISKKKELLDEACLSVPGYHGKVLRSPKATIRAYDETGKKIERGGSGLLAQVFQHECDHLDGVLYVEKAKEISKDEPEKNTPAQKNEYRSK